MQEPSPIIDHRDIAQRLDLLHFQDEAPGMVFWHPRGFCLYRLLEDAARRQVRLGAYREVRTPQLLRQKIWEASGHWDNFSEGMLKVESAGSRQAALKPVSCPGHIQIAASSKLSYRDLPLRLAEFGLVHRDEPSGSLKGLLRLRQFTQDDGHIFCCEDQVVAEVAGFCGAVVGFYQGFGFDEVSVGLSLRPEGRFGEDAQWDRAEADLARGAESAGLSWFPKPGEGAFYGPKLEFSLRDREGRSWQCGTIQLDLFMPQRFDLGYIDAEGRRLHPVMLHRALFGSLERFMGVLLEHHEGRLPAWLAPEQIRIMPLKDDCAQYALGLRDVLVAEGLRVEVDGRSERVSRKLAESHEAAVPFAAILGWRERDKGSVSLRVGQQSREMGFGAAVGHLVEACRAPV